MLSMETIFAYVATVLVLMSTPGPSHLLMLSNSASHTFKRATMTAFGDLSANALQITAAGAGLAAALLASQTIFNVIKWIGVAYLVWMGLRLILNAGRMSNQQAAQKASLKVLYMQGFLTSAANPKAVVFFAALFPQFIDPAFPVWPQIAALGALYILIDGTFLMTYGLLADRLTKRFASGSKIWLDRVSGGFLIVSAILLGLKSVQGR
ncbi:MAG: LysE family translocator [Hyphomicrobiales bacterium]